MAPEGRRPSNQSKRQQSQSHCNNTTLPQQQSIQHHFNSTQHKHHTKGSPVAELSPKSKRRKLDTPHSPPSNATLSTSHENMYNFGSSATNGNNVVDLTKAGSPPSCRARRISTGLRMDSSPQLSAPLGAKKLVVKNLRTTSKSDPNNYCNKTVVQLDAALTAIFANERPALSNEELYRGVENVCKLGKADDLSKKLLQRCKEHISGPLKEPLLARAGDKSQDVLRAVTGAWTTWTKQLLTIRSIFFYLDRSHLLQAQKPSIYESAVIQFRSHVFGETMLQPKVIAGAYDFLLADRTGMNPDPPLFKSAVKMFHELGVYTEDFEPRMLAESQKYVSQWSDEQTATLKLPEYVAACGKLIDQEMERCDIFELDSTTQIALLTLLEHHLIERREDYLVDADAVADELDANSIDNLKRLYQLLQRRRLGARLKSPFAKWIDDTGSNIVFDEKLQDQMVTRLLEFKSKLDRMWRFAFGKHEEIGHVLRESFEAFINKSKKTSQTWGTDNSKPGEMIAKYVDQLLRNGAKAIPSQLTSGKLGPGLGKPAKALDRDDENEDDAGFDEDSEVNNQLDQVLDLFRFVHGKAVFEAFYKKDLARRLLMGRSASNDAERSMLTRLKTECGSGFTQNLEQMFRDVELANDEMTSYKNHLEANELRADIDLTVKILSASAWPTYPEIPVIIPAEIKRAIDRFETHYQRKHTGRKLQWKHALAHCVLKADFPKGKKEIIVSSFQAIILMLFNGVRPEQHLTYEHIKTESGLSDVEVQRTLQSLACAKLRPLTKHPKGREVDATDTFTLDTSFKNDKFRVKINAIQLKETQEENKETHERVAADRQYETQAAVVRIMKSRKTIGHQELIAETIKATKSRGTLQPADIKRNIDKLIEKEYMERIEGNRYEYLA